MNATRLIVVLAVALVLLPVLVLGATPTSGRLEGRLPDNAPVVSIDQPRGTVLDALSALTKQADCRRLAVHRAGERDHAPAHPAGLEARRRGPRSAARCGLAPSLVRRRRPPGSRGRDSRRGRFLARAMA